MAADCEQACQTAYDELKDQIVNQVNDKVNDLNNENAQYDAETGYGATQNAVLDCGDC